MGSQPFGQLGISGDQHIHALLGHQPTNGQKTGCCIPLRCRRHRSDGGQRIGQQEQTINTGSVLFAQALQHSLRVGCDGISSRPQPGLKPGPRVGKALKRRVIALGNHQMAIEAPADLTTHNIGAAQKRKNPLRASRSDQSSQLIRMRPRNTGHGPVQKPPALSWLKRAQPRPRQGEHQ